MERENLLSRFSRNWILLNGIIFAGLVSVRAQTPQIVPFLDEVIVDPQAHRGTAYFGYRNPTNFTVTIASGQPNNFFFQSPEDRGQPTQFLPGERHYAFAAIFDYNSQPNITWILNGLQATASAANAGANTTQTSAFTYQGKLIETNSVANGTYQMRFTLFDTEINGTQIASPIEVTNVFVVGGLFTAPLDFGFSPFSNGSSRFLQIEVASGTNAYAILSPRQRITSLPYTTRAFSAATADTATTAQQLNGTSANFFVQTTDARLSDARTPTAGSANYIQNGTNLQANSSLHISGDGEIGGNLTVDAGHVGIGVSNPQVPLHVDGGSDASATTGGYIISGAVGASNIVIDDNEIMARNNGAVSTLFLNHDGGAISCGGSISATAFNTTSDRNLKTNFAPVDARGVLDKVIGLPLTKWNFKNEPDVPHVGPMAQDFHAAFGFGADDRHIATVDADGVALAAIQGLNQKVDELRGELNRRSAENAELKARLEKLERFINQTNSAAKDR